MKLIKYLTLFICIGALAACGGGGGGSSGGGINATFTGTASVVFSTRGVPPQSFPLPITITVSGGMVTVLDADGDSGSAPLSADGMNFIVPVRFTTSSQGVTCQGLIIYNGAISDTEISGTLSGDSPCSGAGVSFVITTSGSFSASQSGSAKMERGIGSSTAMKTVIDQIAN